MMWWFKSKKIEPKKEEVAPPQVEKNCHKLIIKFKDGSTTGYEISKEDLTTVVESFKPFIKWYFGRPESKEYLFPHRDGFVLYRREDIATFSLTDKTKKE